MRQASNLTQEQVAEAAGVHPTYIPRIEAGAAVPSVDVLMRLAAALRTPVGFIMSAVDERPHTDEQDPLRQEIAALVHNCDIGQLRLIRDVVRDVRRHWVQ